MNKARHYIRILLLMLLLVGSGTGNEAWAAKVRYHILTLPFSIRNYNNTGYYKQNIRVEALLVISDAPTVGLPEQYKSPLAKEFKYFKGWSEKEYNYLFHYASNPHVLEVKYWIYSQNGGAGYSIDMTNDDEIDASKYTDIYVTYEYDKEGEAAAREIFLDKTQDYNITVGGNKFLCYNRSRNNRIANANTGALTGEDLVNEDFVVPDKENQLGFSWSTDQYAGKHGVHMGFWLAPTPYEYDPEPDPYNITLMTAYVGNETYQKDPVENQYFVKPYKGATLFSLISSNANGKGTETKMWFDCDNDLHYKGVPNSAGINDKNSPNYWEKRVDYWPGYFRHTNQPIFNSVALLNHPNGKGYVFVGSKFNQGVGSGTYTEWAPNSNGNYATLTNDNNNPFMSFKTLASSPVINIYKIRKYILKIKTHGSKTELQVNMRWSDAKASDKIVDHLPDAFKRKYCSYKAYADEALKKEITTFEDAIKKAKSDPADITIDGDNIVLWFDYTVTESFPFETLPEGGSYVNARWYTMRMNGKAEQKNIAYHDNNNLITADGSGNAKGDNASTKLHDGENSPEAQVAFMGDPYELKIISRDASEAATRAANAPANASHNRYIGCATVDPEYTPDNAPLFTNKEDISGNIITWEMVYENTDMGNFILREFDTYAEPKYIGWDDTKLNKPVIYSTADYTDKNRIRVVELDKIRYAYHIMDMSGNIAVKAIVSQDIGTMLRTWQDIPEIIRSPHLYDATVYYYATSADATNNDPLKKIKNTPYTADGVATGVYANIYVRYTFASERSNGTFNVRLNNDYIFTNSTANIQSQTSITNDEANTNPYQWELKYQDPYAMTIQSLGKDQYVNVTSGSAESILGWDSANGTKFIIKSGSLPNTYEVMAATGDDVDASTTYYNIGRPTENTVKLYRNDKYVHGNEVLRFQFIGKDAHDVTYYLVDKSNSVLLHAITRQTSTDEIAFPPEYHSPLVKEYYYYPTESDAKSNTNKIDLTETKVGSATTFYVTYEVNDLVNLKAGQLYLMKYEAGEVFRQEDGNNGLLDDPAEFEGTDDEKIARYKAIYPYVNGDGNFFVYGEYEYQQQQVSASTRTRWVWYVQSDLGTKGDPYHVTIRSFQAESYPIRNSSDYNAYFMTYKPEGYSEVVTTLAWPGMSGETPTEYMVLGSEGQYQLVTTYPIAIDKNNNNTIDEGESERYVVNSFEQYWKTYDTIKKILLADLLDECTEKDQTDDKEGSIEVPTVPASLRERLTEKKKEGGLYEFHNYAKWAYAKRWNGYNNGYSSTTGTPETKKGWETREHWYQTIDMGQGYFNFVKASVDPVLILLDQHGWEIMRKPLPSSPDDPLKDAKYEAIRAYNSPMVKEYKFYSDNTKATGYHKYIPKTPITVDGKQYVSTSLTSLPPYETAVNVKDKKGNLNDQYVTYTVKDEYANTYSCSYSEGVATETVKPFLIQQGDYFVSVSNDNIDKNTLPAGGMNQYIMEYYNQLTETGSKKNELWYIRPNRDIDLEMGMAYSASLTDTTKKEPWTRVTTEDYYNIHHLNGFDPYNIQIQSVSSNTKYLVTDATGANVVDGAMEATYSASPTISLDAWKEVTGTGNDHNTLQMTNATFMVVQDEKGNMQLMPRFDHSTRMSEFGTLIAPTDAEVAKTYTKLYRPVVYDYRIIDNDGHESLRYKSGGDMLPQTPDHFKSPLATNFEYYATATYNSETHKYSAIKDTIKASLDGAPLNNNIVYVRYEYDEDADRFNILKGNWMTMQLNEKDALFKNGSAGIYASSGTYSLTATDDNDRNNQAKYLANTGDYYVRKGTGTYTYEKITVTSGYKSETYAVYTTTTGDYSSEWTSSTGRTATDDDDMRSKAQKLTANGDYYFRIGNDPEHYTYVKVTVESPYQSETFAVLDPPTPTSGDYSSNWDSSKPLIVNADGKKWQWKFVGNALSNPDPYAVYLFNRYAKNVKQPDDSRFALLSHSVGDYALAKAGRGDYTYEFLNGSSMTNSAKASIAEDKVGDNPSGFTSSSGSFHGTDSQVKLTDEVQHSYIYKVYTNGGQFAIEANQTQKEAESNSWIPVLPESARTPLLNIENYRYYEQNLTGTVAKNDTLNKSLSLIYGLYDDIIYTHYTPYNDKESNYLVPNVRNDKGSNSDPVARDSKSNDAPLGLNGIRLYNIIWYKDNMMKSNGTSIECDADQDLQSTAAYEWVFEGGDPYAIKIKSDGGNGNYIHETTSSTTTELSSTPTTFMLLNREGYDYGVLAKTGEKGTMLSEYGNVLTTSDPTKFIIFALSTYKVIYHLIIANINSSVNIPYKKTENGDETTLPIAGSTLRDLKTREETEGDHVDGDNYQLGESLSTVKKRMKEEDKITVNETNGLFINKYIYCKDVGHVSLGDVFEVPSELYRPNVHYDYYIEGVYNSDGSENSVMNTKYKGLKMTNLDDDSELLEKIVCVNIVYSFMGGLDTNSGSDFVKKVDDNKWYTFETSDATPRLAECTGTTLKTVSGYATHYTNDYLWTPVGDPYGFKMYNRYLYKNQGEKKVMSTTTIGTDNITMVDDDKNDPYVPHQPANSVYELLTTNTTTPGYFIVHPVVNKTGTQYYMTNNSSTMTLSKTPKEWTFGLSEEMMRPYYQAAGYVGGLNEAGKAAYDVEAANTNPLERLMGLQNVVYNHDNDGSDPENTTPNYIVHYAPGYYRLHNQPGSEGISTPRYASGYTHKTELTAGDGGTAIPMHFYEMPEYTILNPVFSDLNTANSDNYTSTVATRGDIPLSTVTYDPASIFMFTGENGSVTMSTQRLNVLENKMTTGNGTSFTITDIGGGVVALKYNTNYLGYKTDEKNKKYDLSYGLYADESARWCMQPVQKDTVVGNGEMGLMVKTYNGDDGYYYASFYAPFDALLTSENDAAYVVKEWPTSIPAMIHPKKIGNFNTGDSYPEKYRGNNQFIPAGTPVIIRTTNPIGYVKMALPTTTASTSVTTALRGEYLEQMLDDSSHEIYGFGRSLGTYKKESNFDSSGLFESISPNAASTDIGFFVNANPNKESAASKSSWTRNNKYVYANKIYYLYTPPAPSPSPSRELTRSPEFIPVVFDEDDDDDEPIEESVKPQVFNGCVYDLQGRCVATEEMVKDGTWRRNLKRGIYILNGKKVYVK